MQKRNCYFSQIVLLVLGILFLISFPIFHDLYYYGMYALFCVYFFIEAAEAEFSYVLLLIVFVASNVVIPALSLISRKCGSDIIYHTFRKICNCILAVYTTLAVCLVYLFLFGEWLFIAWAWCEKHGETPVEMLLLLAPVFLLFFSKIGLRLPRHVGNASLAVLIFGIFRFFTVLLSSMGGGWFELFILTLVFLTVWFFEQTLRNCDGKLLTLERILLTAMSLFGGIITLVKSARFAYDMAVLPFSWYTLNSLIVNATVFALFVAFAVKIQKGSKLV